MDQQSFDGNVIDGIVNFIYYDKLSVRITK